MPRLGWRFAPLRASPHNPQDRFHKQPRIAAALAGISVLAKAEGLDDRPMGVGQGHVGSMLLSSVRNQKSELTTNRNPERQQALIGKLPTRCSRPTYAYDVGTGKHEPKCETCKCCASYAVPI